MSKLFFDHLLVLDEVEVEIKRSASSREEREELWGLVDDIVNPKVFEILKKEFGDSFKVLAIFAPPAGHQPLFTKKVVPSAMPAATVNADFDFRLFNFQNKVLELDHGCKNLGCYKGFCNL